MSIFRRFALVLVAALPVSALAAGGHDSVGCTGCHSIHAAKGEIIFAVPANKTGVNPYTKQPYSGTTALCLGCHEDSAKGGQGYAPIHANLSHPYGIEKVDPRKAKVPSELLRNGRFECIGCHDPHPSNPNYKYLRVDTAKGSNMDGFCGVCHPIKADPAAVKSAVLFTSMDETSSRMVSAQPAGTAPVKDAAASSGSKKAKK